MLKYRQNICSVCFPVFTKPCFDKYKESFLKGTKMTGYLILLPLIAVAVLAIYYVLFKIRKELNASQGKIASSLLEIQKVLEKK